jgi:hypothetical protein
MAAADERSQADDEVRPARAERAARAHKICSSNVKRRLTSSIGRSHDRLKICRRRRAQSAWAAGSVSNVEHATSMRSRSAVPFEVVNELPT